MKKSEFQKFMQAAAAEDSIVALTWGNMTPSRIAATLLHALACSQRASKEQEYLRRNGFRGEIFEVYPKDIEMLERAIARIPPNTVSDPAVAVEIKRILRDFAADWQAEIMRRVAAWIVVKGHHHLLPE